MPKGTHSCASPALVGSWKRVPSFNWFSGCLTSLTLFPSCFCVPYTPRMIQFSSWLGRNHHLFPDLCEHWALLLILSYGSSPVLYNFLTDAPISILLNTQERTPTWLSRAVFVSISLLMCTLSYNLYPIWPPGLLASSPQLSVSSELWWITSSWATVWRPFQALVSQQLSPVVAWSAMSWKPLFHMFPTIHYCLLK